MANIVVIPKRKTLQSFVRDRSGDITTINEASITLPSPVTPNPITILKLSNLFIDVSKDWLGFSIEDIGAPSNALGAVRKADLLTAIEFIIDGGGAAITTGQKGHIRLPFAGTIVSVALAADQSGSIVIDIWKDTLANFPPTDADSITASAPPTLSSQQVILDATLTGWTKTFAYGDFMAFNVDSCSTITRVTLTLVVVRS
jgi:hypothetical protein